MADPTEVALRVVDALSREGLPSAIGGALAFGRWVRPRATLDADINVFAGEDSFERILDVMHDLGAVFDRADCLERFRRGDVAFVRFEDVRVDLFVPSIPFYELAEQTVVHTDIGGRQVPFLSAEALAVFKLLFFRSKDMRDLEALVEELGDRLDVAWVRHHVAAMMGEDDERIRDWDRLVERFG
ncbi:MAG: nucleotidyltransferase [Armatimonadetes bacterium]|nr:nucleotidyltransferase [Armatimonadota bacterium]